MKFQGNLEVIANSWLHLQQSWSFTIGIKEISRKYNVRIKVSYNSENCTHITDFIGKPKGSIFYIEIEGQEKTEEALNELLGYCSELAIK
jgi:hypothetical protein